MLQHGRWNIRLGVGRRRRYGANWTHRRDGYGWRNRTHRPIGIEWSNGRYGRYGRDRSNGQRNHRRDGRNWGDGTDRVKWGDRTYRASGSHGSHRIWNTASTCVKYIFYIGYIRGGHA